MVCTTRTPNIGPIAQRDTWYMDHAFPRYTCLDIRKCTKFKRLSHYLNPLRPRRLISILWKPMVCTTRTPNIGPIAQRATWYMAPLGTWTMLPTIHLSRYTALSSVRLSHYLIRCVHRADFHLMEAYGLYYSYEYWTHSSKGYLVHGPCFPRYTCLDIRKCTKFKRLSHYLIRCVQRADFHFMEAFGLYYSYTQYWTHSSKGYLVHGPCFPRYTCLDIRKMH